MNCKTFGVRCLTIALGGAIASLLLQGGVMAQTLNEKVLGMERGLEQEFETYFGRDLAEVTDDPEDVGKTLTKLGAETNTKPAVLWVMPRETHLHLVLVTANGEVIVRDLYDVPKSLFVATVEKFTEDVTNERKTPDLAASKQLHRWILEPYEAEFLTPQEIDTILFCLGAGARGLPIAALYDGEQFLVEKYASSKIPAFNLIDRHYTNIQQGGILAMGASEFQEQPPLPAVPVELSTVVQQLRSQKSPKEAWSELSLLNRDFTQKNLASILSVRNFDIVHLATHADFQSGQPENSYIQFSDGKLNIDQISQLPWQNSPVELLVLSACRTALGDETAELGFAGLALQSGVKSAIATLWYVSDAGTLALMGDFYQELSLASTKAEALRQTQIKMLRGDITIAQDKIQLARGSVVPIPADLGSEFLTPKDLSHPYYWAGFNLISSPW